MSEGRLHFHAHLRAGDCSMRFITSSGGATRQVDQVSDAEAFGQRDINELRASDRHKRSPAEGSRMTVRINSRSCKIDLRVRCQ
jgi:hypothetical protein